jgi:hypothetical protein
MKRLSLVLACLALGCGSNPVSSASPFVPSDARLSTPRPPLDSTLTLTASASCSTVTDWVTHRTMSFPEQAKQRRFLAKLTDASLFVSSWDPYDASRAGNQLTIIVPPSAEDLDRRDNSASWQNRPPTQSPSCGGGDYWHDNFGAATPYGYLEAVEVCGTWHAQIADSSRISGTIDGAFVYYKGIGPKFDTVLYCRAADHEFTITTP